DPSFLGTTTTDIRTKASVRLARSLVPRDDNNRQSHKSERQTGEIPRSARNDRSRQDDTRLPPGHLLHWLCQVTIRTVGVVGCGLMGSGIAEVSARAGYTTIVREINDDLLHQGRQRIEKSMATAVERGKLAQSECEAALDRMRGTTRLEDFSNC